MIITTTSEMRKHLLSFNLKEDKPTDESRFASFIARAQEWVTEHIIGEGIEEILEIDLALTEPDPHQKLRGLLGRVISEMAYLTSIAESDLQRSEAGFVVQNNDKMSPASLQRVERLIQNLNERIDMDCDSLVNYLMKNSVPPLNEEHAPYEGWRQTEQFANLTVAFLPMLKQLRHHLTSKNSYTGHWADFNASLQKMSINMMDLASRYVSSAEIIRLRGLYREDDLNEVQQQAVFRLQSVAVACLMDDQAQAHMSAIGARYVMLDYPNDFPSFVASDCYELPSPFNFGDGTVANGL